MDRPCTPYPTDEELYKMSPADAMDQIEQAHRDAARCTDKEQLK